MEDPFFTKYGRHEFKLLYDTISFYYPIGLSLSIEEYQNHPGIIKIGDLINENFIRQKNYRDKWVTFKKYLKNNLRHKIVETMVAFYPCYSGSVIIENKKFEQYTRIKKLNFYISLLGPYYSIVGVDESIIKLDYRSEFPSDIKVDSLDYPAVHAFTVSPYLEFEKDFLALENQIKEYFSGFRIIPHQIYTTKITGLSYPDPCEENLEQDSIFSALFNPDIKFLAPTRGDEHYGFDEWLIVKKLLPQRIQEIKQRLLINSEINNKNTIHRVWKLKKVNPLPNPSLQGYWGMENLDVIDLTDKNTAFIIVKENEEPFTSPYTLTTENLSIHSFEDKINFKISTLTSIQLVLILNINFKIESGYRFAGDVAEIIYELYS